MVLVPAVIPWSRRGREGVPGVRGVRDARGVPGVMCGMYQL